MDQLPDRVLAVIIGVAVSALAYLIINRVFRDYTKPAEQDRPPVKGSRYVALENVLAWLDYDTLKLIRDQAEAAAPNVDQADLEADLIVAEALADSYMLCVNYQRWEAEVAAKDNEGG